ncbi:TIGR02206 family membrane protein [Winogradskyella sp. A3E31]|uniref:YwaF family protein n=1 Tax=Winogradskyella sp. A3E31 TaxID=3349637 RepID=UPI00398A86DC
MFLFKSIVISERVTIGSIQHLAPIVLVAVLAFLLIPYSKKYLDKQQQYLVFKGIGCLVSLMVISYHIWKILSGNYNFSTDLPLFLCSFLALIIPVFSFYRKFWMYEVLLFIIIAGTTQGVITPDIPEGFPSFDYFRYWTVHLGLLLVIFYATFVFRMRPTFKSVFKAFLALQIYAIVVLLLNWLLNANYSYLSKKPESASALDFFHDWPYYILELELIVLPYFLLIYGVFYVFRAKN